MKDLVRYVNAVGRNIPSIIDEVSEAGPKGLGEHGRRFFGFYELTGFKRFWYKVRLGIKTR